jgi:hypothetical protein
MAGGAYRNRSADSTEQARAAAEATQAAAARSHAALRQRGPTVNNGDAADASNQTSIATPQRTYRSGGGMSRALEQNRAAVPQVSRPVRTAPSRSLGGSTGMPREMSRGVEVRESAPISRPSGGGMSGAQRSDGGDAGGSPRGESGGGSYRSHPAARGGAPR